MEDIQNLDQVLVDLERARITIYVAKSQFYLASIKIIGYIYDADGRNLNISKILRIIDWSKYINITLVWTFLGIYIYY